MRYDDVTRVPSRGKRGGGMKDKPTDQVEWYEFHFFRFSHFSHFSRFSHFSIIIISMGRKATHSVCNLDDH